KRLEPCDLILCPAVYDRHVLALDIAGVFQALAKCAQKARVGVRQCGVEDPDPRHRALLRARRERPSRRCAAENHDKLAPFHSITSSAATSSVFGTLRLSVFAVLRLITSSNLVGP